MYLPNKKKTNKKKQYNVFTLNIGTIRPRHVNMQCLLDISHKDQHVMDGQANGQADIWADNVKTVSPPPRPPPHSNTICRG